MVMQNTHQFDIDDQRENAGKAFITVGAIDGHIDEMISVTMEVSTNPLTGIEHVPCAHVHFDDSNVALSLMKIGNRILINPETDVSISPFKTEYKGVKEILFWVDNQN